jgi:hypothetical protein
MLDKGINFKSKYRISIFLVMVLAGSLLGLAPSSAANSTITACVNIKTGAMRMLQKGTCKAKVEKKITWQTNISTGAASQSGSSSLWFTPRDLLPASGSSTVSSVQIGDYQEEVLDLSQEAPKFFWRGVPKGWGSAKSSTWKIYWTTDGVGAKVGFTLFTASGTEGATVSPDLVPGCNDGCSSSTQKDPLAAGKMNVTTITLNNTAGGTGEIVEGGIFHIGFERSSQLWVAPNYVDKGLYQGKVYVFGMSVSANF